MRLLKKKAKVSKEKSKKQEVDPLLSEELDQEEFDSFSLKYLKKSHKRHQRLF